MSRREYALQTQSPLPPEYRQLEYLESTGTQYIDTGYYASSNTEFIVDFISHDVQNTSGHSIFAARHDWNDRGYQLTTYTNSSSLKGHFLWRSTRYNVNMIRDQRQIIVLQNRKIYTNGVQVSSLGNYSFVCDMSMAIFANHQYVGGPRFWELSSTTLYSLQFYENSVCVRDYLPALRIADSKPGLYDIENNQFYINQGTGEFLYN